jgi:hypothetical protein
MKLFSIGSKKSYMLLRKVFSDIIDDGYFQSMILGSKNLYSQLINIINSSLEA